jgi:hypothetical protein
VPDVNSVKWMDVVLKVDVRLRKAEEIAAHYCVHYTNIWLALNRSFVSHKDIMHNNMVLKTDVLL